MGDSQDDHPRRKSVVSLSTPKTVECRRASTTAALATIHIPSVFDLTAFVGVGEPGGISLEISIPQTRQKPKSRASLHRQLLPPLPTSPLLSWTKIWRAEGKNLPILLHRAQKASLLWWDMQREAPEVNTWRLWRRPAFRMGSEFHCIWDPYIGWCSSRLLVCFWLPRLERTTQKLY